MSARYRVAIESDFMRMRLAVRIGIDNGSNDLALRVFSDPVFRTVDREAAVAPSADERESWTLGDPDIDWVAGDCWAVEWVDEGGWETVQCDEGATFPRIPVSVSCDEGPVIAPVTPHPLLPIACPCHRVEAQR
jgi:hypothetical protein